MFQAHGSRGRSPSIGLWIRGWRYPSPEGLAKCISRLNVINKFAFRDDGRYEYARYGCKNGVGEVGTSEWGIAYAGRGGTSRVEQ